MDENEPAEGGRFRSCVAVNTGDSSAIRRCTGGGSGVALRRVLTIKTRSRARARRGQTALVSMCLDEVALSGGQAGNGAGLVLALASQSIGLRSRTRLPLKVTTLTQASGEAAPGGTAHTHTTGEPSYYRTGGTAPAGSASGRRSKCNTMARQMEHAARSGQCDDSRER